MKTFFVSTLSSIAFLTATLTSAQPASSQYEVIGYYNNWDTYDRAYQPADIPINDLTQVLYAFTQVGNCAPGSSVDNCLSGAYATGKQDYKLYSTDPYSDFKTVPAGYHHEGDNGKGNMGLVIKKAHDNKKLALLSVGGYTLSDPITIAIQDAHRHTFIQSITAFLDVVKKDTGDTFDGVDIDWEPNENQWSFLDTPDAKAILVNYLNFLQQLKSALQAHDPQHAHLTVAIPASAATIKKADNVLPGFWQDMSNTVDSMDVMSYDYHGAFDTPAITNFLAPQHFDDAQPSDVANRTIFNIDATINAYLAAKVPASKMILGIPAYGRAVKGVIDSSDAHGLYKPFDKTLTSTCPGEYNDNTCTYDYKYIALNMLNSGFKAYENKAAGDTYAYNPTTQMWISYDSPADAHNKAENIKHQKLGGAMVWSLSGDISPYSNDYTATSIVHELAETLNDAQTQ